MENQDNQVFSTITELKTYLAGLTPKQRKAVVGFNCKYELFIHESTADGGYRVLWSAYYGTNNACLDICELLDIVMEEV